MMRLYRSAHARQVAGRVGGVPVLSQPAPRISAECPLAKTFVTLERAKTATSHRHTYVPHGSATPVQLRTDTKGLST
jgi:hypothetical protein